MRSPREIIERAILGKTVTRGVPDALAALAANGYEIVHTAPTPDQLPHEVLEQHAIVFVDGYMVTCRCEQEFWAEQDRTASDVWALHASDELAKAGWLR